MKWGAEIGKPLKRYWKLNNPVKRFIIEKHFLSTTIEITVKNEREREVTKQKN